MRTAGVELRVGAAPLRLSWSIAALLGVAVAAGAVGAVAGRVHTHVGSAPAAPRISVLLSYVAVATIVSTLVVGLTLFVILSRAPKPKQPDEEEEKEGPSLTRLQRVLIELAALCLVFAPIAAILLLAHPSRKSGLQGLPGPPPGSSGAGRGTDTTASTSGHVEWTFFLALVVAALVMVAFVAVSLRRRAMESEPEADDELEPLVAAGVSALASERDPRRAVIKAYAAMERTLGAQGLPRDPVETPFEYLRRVLVQLGATGRSAGRLTGLFEQAKFSRHEIDEGMRADALSALQALRGGNAA